MLRTEKDGQTLSNLLFGAYRHRVLSLLYLRPGDRFHVRMIARLTGVPAGSLHRELRQLADAGLLVATRSGNQVLYGANEDSPVFAELASMLDKTAETTPTLHDHAAELSVEPAGGLPPIDARALAAVCRKYGVKTMSLIARNDMQPDSDLDLMIEFKRTSKATLFDYVGMQEALSPLFGNRRIRLSNPGLMGKRKTILPDLQTLYEARRS